MFFWLVLLAILAGGVCWYMWPTPGSKAKPRAGDKEKIALPAGALVTARQENNPESVAALPLAPSVDSVDDYSRWPDDPALRKLLSTFLRPQPAVGGVPDYWISILGQPPQYFVDRFIASGVLVPSALSMKLDHQFTAAALKDLLRERKLKLAGNKKDLIDRLIAADEPGMRRVVADLNIVEVSPAVRAKAVNFIAEGLETQKSAMETSLSLLRAGCYEESVLAMTTFESAQLFPRGMGMDWSDETLQADLTNTVKIIFSGTPKLLQGKVAEHEIENLRLVVALRQLWGNGNAADLVTSLPESYKKFDAQEAINIYSHFAHDAAQLERYRLNGVKHVEIHGDETMACAACRRLVGQRYAIGEVPEIPPARCSCDYCSCRYYGDYNEIVLALMKAK